MSAKSHLRGSAMLGNKFVSQPDRHWTEHSETSACIAENSSTSQQVGHLHWRHVWPKGREKTGGPELFNHQTARTHRQWSTLQWHVSRPFDTSGGATNPAGTHQNASPLQSPGDAFLSRYLTAKQKSSKQQQQKKRTTTRPWKAKVTFD